MGGGAARAVLRRPGPGPGEFLGGGGGLGMGPSFLIFRSANSNDNILLPLQDVIYVSTFMKVYFLHIKLLHGIYNQTLNISW